MPIDTDISNDQNITFGQVAPFVEGANVSRKGAIDAYTKFNTLTNFVGLGADITADINKNTALRGTGDEVLDIVDEYNETSPTNILQAQNNIAERQRERLTKQSEMGYTVTN